MDLINIFPWGLVVSYLLLIVPAGILLWAKVPILGRLGLSVVRMSLQLLFVGFYLQVIFNLNQWWLTILWLVVMITVADFSILKGCGFKLSKFGGSIFLSLLIGTAVPLLYFVGVILRVPGLIEARYAIPIGGMILGNCLRADIIGIGYFYNTIRFNEKRYFQKIAEGANLSEATKGFTRDAMLEALSPTIATMATIGLVSLPGMMTGVILGGASPVTAIAYQIAIMVAIFTGTTITVLLAILFSRGIAFNDYGTLDKDIFS